MVLLSHDLPEWNLAEFTEYQTEDHLRELLLDIQPAVTDDHVVRVKGPDVLPALNTPEFLASRHLIFVPDASKLPGFALGKEFKDALEQPATALKKMMAEYTGGTLRLRRYVGATFEVHSRQNGNNVNNVKITRYSYNAKLDCKFLAKCYSH